MDDSIKSPVINLNNLRVLKILGKGAMGTVFLVYNKINDPTAQYPFALKVFEKSSLPAKPDSDRRSRWEISVLNRLSHQDPPHPFLPFLLGFVDTDEYICCATPFCSGGDLNTLRRKNSDHVFSTAAIRFYLAEIICALEKLHNMGIVYRDLKPENILIQSSGHLTLTDFDLSCNLSPKSSGTLASVSETEIEQTFTQRRNLTRFVTSKLEKKKDREGKKSKRARVSPVSRKSGYLSNERSNSFVGTEEYIAPEVIRGDGHEFSVDWWALGILGYEMLYGKTPFRGKNRKETFQKILYMEPVCVGKTIVLTDLLVKLLDKDPTKRLGYRKGCIEIKNHEFFQGMRWDLLTEVFRPPHLPLIDKTELTEGMSDRGINVMQYILKLKTPPSPLLSSSRKISLTEF